MIRKVLLGLVIVLMGAALLYWDLIQYGIGQGLGQLKVLREARPIAELLEDPALDENLKKKLRQVGEIKQFAIDEIQLKTSENYTTVYDQSGKPILWVVRACEPYQLKNKEWSFPIVGTVSYKGFFSLEKAKKLQAELQKDNYDTYILEVSAWSTLGWFKDPLMSEVLKDSEGGLANTIIHELTHATIFVKDSLTFNENLASFVGDKGAEFYLSSKYSATSEELKQYIYRKEDRANFSNHFILGAKKLDSLYKTLDDTSEEVKKRRKNAMIQDIVDNLDTVSFHNKNYNSRFSKQLPNNAFFMSFLLYRSGQGTLDSLFYNEYNGNLSLMVTDMRKSHPTH